jgi:hypothetical protein
MPREAFEVVTQVEERAVLVGIDRPRTDGWTLDELSLIHISEPTRPY